MFSVVVVRRSIVSDTVSFPGLSHLRANLLVGDAGKHFVNSDYIANLHFSHFFGPLFESEKNKFYRFVTKSSKQTC